VPELRGHGRSQGTVFTMGFLERDDVALAVDAARGSFGFDPDRIGIHSCSAGSSVALEFAAGRAGVRAIWLESPFAEPREMARHYLSRATGIPAPLLTLASRWAVAAASARLRADLREDTRSEGVSLVDPLRAVARVTAPILLVHGDADRLVPTRFTRRLAAALPPHSGVWNAPGAGHCHHADEPQAIARLAYERRWEEFFRTYLPA
jgi:pimeloyl-ACP methyl ester carboxylesterase